MNNIFLKNLKALELKNPKLKEIIQTFIPTEVPKLIQENNSYNILYKNKVMHNPQNPLGEANQIFSMAENTPISIHIIHGLGLGYLFQITSLNSKGTVILYEPDLNILWFALTLIDFSNDILKENVYITTYFDELAECVYQKSGIKNSPLLLSLPSQRELYPEEFEDFIKKIQNLIGSFSLDLKFTQQKFYPSLKMLIENIPYLLSEIPLAQIKNKYQGKTAVIVSAGPTLDRNIEFLKKYRNRFVLFTVGTAIKTLYKNNIKPDYLCIIETYDSSKQIEGLDLSDVNFITEPYSNPIYRNFKFKNIFSHISCNNQLNQFWSKISNIDINEYKSKGTVSYTALNSARILGFSKIILVGQDLAYIEGQCYSKDSIYKDLICQFNKESNKWEITAKDFDEFSNVITASENPKIKKKTALRRLKNLNNSLHYVKGISGEMIPTESVYATFIKPLQEFTVEYNNHKYINTSLVGAQIDGFENMSLEDALKDSEIIDKININTQSCYNKNLIFENLNNKKNCLSYLGQN